MPDGPYEVYTDGSYIHGKVTYAFVILRGGEAVHEGAGVVPPSFAKSRQVGGEIMAVLEALSWFEANGVEEASVHYDFENLALWVRGAYRANTEISQALVAGVRGSTVKLKWNKVRAHTGVEWNERVDKLAKQAAANPSPQPPPLKGKGEKEDGQGRPSYDRKEIAGGSDPLVDELERIVEPLQAAAAAVGVDTRFVGILNGQFARLEILKGEKRVGMFDLYNTQKKRLNPVISPAGSLEASNMTVIWEDFRRKWRS